MEQVRIRAKVIMEKKKETEDAVKKLLAKTLNGLHKMRRNIGNFTLITKSQIPTSKYHGLNGKMTQFIRKWENLSISCLNNANPRTKI